MRTVSAAAHKSIILWSGAWLGVLVLIAAFGTPDQTSPATLATVAAAVFVAGLFAIAKVSRRGFWSPASLFFVALGLFHLGLAPSWIRGVAPDFPRSSDYQWFNGPEGATALWLVAMGSAGYVVGVLLVSVRGTAARGAQAYTSARDDYSKSLATTGALMLIAAVTVWTLLVARAGGLGVFVGSYSGFLNVTDGSSLGYLYMLIGLGVGLSVIDARLRIVQLALAVFALFAVFAFLLGLRGEVLFPSAVAASVLAAQRRMPRGLPVAAGILLLLTLINGVKQIRATGIASWNLDLSVFSPFAALEELGSSIRVVAYVVAWHGENGEPLRNGDTYTVAIARFVERLISPSSRPSAVSDFRLMNSEIAARSGNIGGSVIGEAYHNFGSIGVPIVLLVVGAIFAYFDTRPSSSVRLAAYVVVAVPLFNHVRNSFVPVVPVVMFGALVVLVVVVVARSRKPVDVAA